MQRVRWSQVAHWQQEQQEAAERADAQQKAKHDIRPGPTVGRKFSGDEFKEIHSTDKNAFKFSKVFYLSARFPK